MQAGAGGRNTQLGQTAEAQLEWRLGKGKPGQEEEPKEASKGPARAQNAVAADHQSAAVELAARCVEERQATE